MKTFWFPAQRAEWILFCWIIFLEGECFRLRHWQKKLSKYLRESNFWTSAWINFNSTILAQSFGLFKSCRKKRNAYLFNWNLHKKCKVLDSELYIENQTCRNREIRVWISRLINNSSNFGSVGRSGIWCQIILNDSESNANLSVKNFYLDLDGRNQTCSEGQTWLQKSRRIKTISFFGKFGQTKIRRRVRSKFLLP